MKRYNLSNLVGSQLHNDDPEIGSSEIERQKLSLLLAVGQAPYVGREALDAGRLVLGQAQAFLKIVKLEMAL